MNNGKVTGAISLDLRKAFDTVSHRLLLEKLNSYGMIGNTLKSYLEQRTCKYKLKFFAFHRNQSWDPFIILLIHFLIL